MKQIMAFICALVLAGAVSAQEKEKITDDGNNELKINLAYFVFEIAELNYERILMDEFSIGLAANYWFDKQSDIDYMINPFFRFYPINTQRRAATFFIEGHAGIIGGTEFIQAQNDMTQVGTGSGDPFGTYWEESFIRGGAGVAVGAKFLSKNHFVGEVYGGLGRIFSSESWPDIYPRVGINFGKRF